MQLRSIFFLLLNCGTAAEAQPEFNGPLSDDEPISNIFLERIGEKNLNVGLVNISGEVLAEGEVEVRIYNNLELFVKGGYPMLSRRLLIRDGELAEALIYPGCRTHGVPATGDLAEAWQVIEEEQLFSIPGEHALRREPGAQGEPIALVDGTTFVVQIASFDSYRSFMVINPESKLGFLEVPRFLRGMEAIDALFPSPDEFCLEQAQRQQE